MAKCWSEWRRAIAAITVEPTMILYMMAFMTTSVVEQAFYVYKACRVNHGLSADICRHLDRNETIKKQVQITVSEFHQWDDVLGHVVPIVLALFLGSWSDRRGRKMPLLLGLIGKLYFSCMIIVNDYQTNWPVEYIIYTATIPSTLTGADVAIFAAAFSYIADVSPLADRTMRVTILDACYLLTMPTGVALGAWLFSRIFDRSYSAMFALNAILLLTAIIYSYWRLEWRTSPQQQPLSTHNNKWGIGCAALADFFDVQHVVASVRTLVRPRETRKRTYLVICIASMALYTFQRDERSFAYLYAQLVYHWSVEQFSAYSTFRSALQVAGVLVGVPLLNRRLQWSDAVIAMVGAGFMGLGRLAYANIEEGYGFYVGGAITSLGPMAGPLLRSMTSKLVPSDERGKALSLLSVADNAVPLVSGVLYTQVYNATIHTWPSAVFYVTLTTQMAVVVLMGIVKLSSKDGDLVHTEATNNDLVEPQEEEEDEDKLSVNSMR